MIRAVVVAGGTVLLALLAGLPIPDAAAQTAAGTGAEAARFTRIPAPDGIQIRRFLETDGAQPGPSDRVSVHYHGTLKSGEVFDSSVDRGRPATFPLNRVIPCWTEAVTRMHVGEKIEVVCPPATAYGSRGAPPRVPPNATLTFEIELLGIE